MQDPRVTFLSQRFKQLSSERAPFENDWMDIRDLVRPISVGYSKLTNSYVSLRTEFMYDGTAPDALEELSAALHSYLSNPTERWFELQIEGPYDPTQDPDGVGWLQTASDIIYDSYRRESVMLNQSLHEIYLDVGSFGTGILYQEWNYDTMDLLFSAKPISDCYILENSKGMVDTMYRKVIWTTRQIEQEFGFVPEKMAKEKNPDRGFELVHAVFPSTDRTPNAMFKSKKPFISAWVCFTTGEMLSEGGYDTFPYHTPRWTKLSGEMYGRGPSKKCLPDIKMLNAMEKTMLKAGQKKVDPPIVVSDEGFLLPIKTSPGALIYKENGTEMPEALHMEGDLQWGLEQGNQKREFIRKCFYADWIKLEKENVEMTAYEARERKMEKLRLMAPILGRLVSELHGGMIQRSYYLLNQHHRIPPAPPSIQKRNLRVGYSSPAARAQQGEKANNMSQFIQEMIPYAQVDPGIMDILNVDQFAREVAIARGVPVTILRSKDEIAAIRKDRQNQQAAQSVAQVAEPASKALKNLADAQRGGINLPGM
jgi:hypothetical protein